MNLYLLIRGSYQFVVSLLDDRESANWWFRRTKERRGHMLHELGAATDIYGRLH